MSERQRAGLLSIMLAFSLAGGACSLLGKEAADEEIAVPTATAMPTEGGASAAPTATGTPTPTLDPAFPTPVLIEPHIAEQEFERGWMFAIEDRAEIWVAAFTHERGGPWTIYEDEFLLSGETLIPEFDQTPPPDKVMPVRGFGWVWANKPEVREALGWGVWIELGQNSTLRYDAGGLINADGDYVPRPGRFTLVNIGGDVFIFDESTSTFTWEPASP